MDKNMIICNETKEPIDLWDANYLKVTYSYKGCDLDNEITTRYGSAQGDKKSVLSQLQRVHARQPVEKRNNPIEIIKQIGFDDLYEYTEYLILVRGLHPNVLEKEVGELREYAKGNHWESRALERLLRINTEAMLMKYEIIRNDRRL